MALKSKRWGSQPPTSMPYFSTRRKPGVVLRVPERVLGKPADRTRDRRREDLEGIS